MNRSRSLAAAVATVSLALALVPASAAARFGDETLREGMRGPDVAKLQQKLSRLGIETTADGAFGPATKRSVETFEAEYERRVNGVCSRADARGIKRAVREQRAERDAGDDATGDGASLDEDDADGGRRHVFPIRGPHSYGSSGSRFGAPRGGRSHMGQDVAAAEGTRLVAVHSGRVAFRQYQAGGAGHYLVIHGNDGSDSVYMHMQAPAVVAPGERVRAGQTIGSVGNTGSSSGPHLHFELWTRHWYDGGAAYDPLPSLRRWDRQG